MSSMNFMDKCGLWSSMTCTGIKHCRFRSTSRSW